mmetsp:Transcript_54358/g.116068  ORF Transcript_54358/g.116068 Transcript_54358/m.116068 type:complete len:991 (+) Transcript_54358:154-3126(+)
MAPEALPSPMTRVWGSRSLLDPLPTEDMSEEHCRLEACDSGREDWKKWGPYVSERQWGTCREDYGLSGNSWEYLPFHLAHQVSYRWGEDGLAGLCDVGQHLCMSLALWNGRDPILKERMFGLGGPQGNHGEDVKDMYYYLDATPTHSYLKMLYKYPQKVFPYDEVRRANAVLGTGDLEFELMDTGIFDDDRYFDVFIEYARDGVDDIYMQVTIHNRGPDDAEIQVLPQVFFRNTWSWGGMEPDEKPSITRKSGQRVDLKHATLGEMAFFASGAETVLICDNETNVKAVESPDDDLRPFDFSQDKDTSAGPPSSLPFGEYYEKYFSPGTRDHMNAVHSRFYSDGDPRKKALAFSPPPRPSKFYHASGKIGAGPYKDAFHRYVIKGDRSAAESTGGTKAAFVLKTVVPAGGSKVVKAVLKPAEASEDPFRAFDSIMKARCNEADEFYTGLQSNIQDEEHKRIQRQALAGMIWTKQFYYYDIFTFFEGDKDCPKPPEERRAIRNSDWDHMTNCDIISMPDKWEFPWYATWDLAFHCLPLALVDPSFAKNQLRLMTKEWYMHPNGQLPAFEWNFSDVNPPVHAWACWRVFQMERKHRGDGGDLVFLEETFHKLMINFTWWVNRKDAEGRNIFQGGFLGLDNIGVFDRGGSLPTGGIISQSDGTSWMAFYSLTLMRMAVELALVNPTYEGVAGKFFEHFLFIARAMTKMTTGQGLWDEEDQFYYDVLTLPTGPRVPLKVRSMVGLIPLFAVEVLEPSILEKLPHFAARAEHLFNRRKDLSELVSRFEVPGVGERRLLSLLRGKRMKALLKRMLDPKEFLSDYGVRALSRYHLDNPYVLECDGHKYEIGYEAAESKVRIMGGNSNWRGPIWMPMNYLIVESLQKFHQYYGENYLVECPTGSGKKSSILGVSDMLSDRLTNLFMPSKDGKGRPALRLHEKMATDQHFKDNILFFEHFHGDSGRGVGASHQTGWTGLVAKIIQARGVEAAEAGTSNEA